MAAGDAVLTMGWFDRGRAGPAHCRVTVALGAHRHTATSPPKGRRCGVALRLKSEPDSAYSGFRIAPFDIRPSDPSHGLKGQDVRNMMGLPSRSFLPSWYARLARSIRSLRLPRTLSEQWPDGVPRLPGSIAVCDWAAMAGGRGVVCSRAGGVCCDLEQARVPHGTPGG